MGFKNYFVKKSIKTIQQEANQHELKRTLGKWNLISLGIGCIIGAGIFVMTGTAAALHAGPAITISFVLAGLACAFAALCYAELASVLPVSGSAYTYAYATLGELAAWIMGWLLILEYGISASAVAVGWSGYLVSFLNDFGIHIDPTLTTATGNLVTLADGTKVAALFNLPAFFGVLAVTGLLVLGVSESARVNNVIVFIKLTVVIAFIVIGVWYINLDNWQPYIPENTGTDGEFGYSGILRAASIIFFAYIGFEAVSTAAAEAKDPQKDMPFGIIGSLVVCTILYIGVAAVLTGIVPYTSLNVPDPMAVAVNAVGLNWFSFFIKIGAITGLSSVMLVLIYSQTRVFYTMSKDGLLPNLFCSIHSRFCTPWINTLVVGIVIAFASAVTPIQVLGDLVSLGTLVAFVIVCISVLYLHYKNPELKRPFATPFKPVIPILGILSCGYLIFSMPLQIFITMKFFFLAGILIYLCYGQFHSKIRLAAGATKKNIRS